MAQCKLQKALHQNATILSRWFKDHCFEKNSMELKFCLRMRNQIQMDQKQ